MPSRFEYAQADGLSPASGFTELDDKTPEQFVALILQRLALNEGLPKDHYTRPVVASGDTPRTSVPHNLPSLQPFFGREEELRKIADFLEPESRTWGALIVGPGGMGKTSLAVRAAYDAPAEDFDKIVFVSLKSRELDDDGVRDFSGFLISGLAELLNELARELGRDEIAKAVEKERPRMLLDALRGTKTLLVLDCLESLVKSERDTVFTFVNRLPAGCKAILTSRVRIGSGAAELILEKLSEDTAIATLAKLAESNPALAKTNKVERLTLYRETGGNPLLLRWTAGQIGRGSCVTFSDAIHYLRSCPEGNDPLEFIFGDLIEHFSEAETRTLCALTYFTLAAKVEHIATIAERDNAEIERALKSLINRSLVVPSEELQTFTLAPMVADFVRSKRPELVAETGDRLERYAYALVLTNGYQHHDRFPLLDEEWLTIAAALPRFLTGPNERLQTLCDALQSFLNFTGRWDESLALSREAEERAVKAGDFSSAGRRALQAGSVHYLRRQAEEVLDCANRATVHWQEAGLGLRERAVAIRLRGAGYELLRDYHSAILAYREVVQLWRSLDAENEDLALGLNSLAEAEQAAGDFDAAERNFREALRIARAIHYPEGLATLTGNLASLALDREDWSQAETTAREALGLSESIGHIELIARQSQNLAQALNRMGRAAEALPHARRAQEIFAGLGVAADTELARAIFRESEKLTSCLYVDKIELRNIRCFESIVLTFHDLNEFSLSNIVLGDNAAGKSTLLRCLAMGLCNEPDATALLASLPGDLIRNGAEEGSIGVYLRRRVGPDLLSITTRIIKVRGTGGDAESVQQETEPREDFPWKDIFVCGYGTSRVAAGTASYEAYSSRTAVATLFDERASLWNPEVALLRRPGDLRVEMERRLLRILMLDAPDNRVISDEGPPSVQGPWGTSAFEVLSDGYRSTAQWLLDLMAWAILADRFGGSGGVQGILLIDELEQHLHPRWQRHVLQRLSRQLPGMQIIATTHTPMIAGGIVDLEPSTISRLTMSKETGSIELISLSKELVRGKRADQILASEAFGLATSRSPGNTEAVARYTELEARVRNSDEEKEYQELTARLSAELVTGESEYERIVEEAVSKTLEQRLRQPPSQPLSLEIKRQLREIFGKVDSK